MLAHTANVGSATLLNTTVEAASALSVFPSGYKILTKYCLCCFHLRTDSGHCHTAESCQLFGLDADSREAVGMMLDLA